MNIKADHNNPRSNKVSPFLVSLDVDGVFYPIDCWYPLLFEPIVNQEKGINYQPNITRDEFEQVILSYYQFHPMNDGTGRYDRSLATRDAFLQLLNEGKLSGFTNEVMREMGREVARRGYLFPGAKEALINVARAIQEDSGGQARVTFMLNSCGFQELLIGMFEDIAKEHPGLISAVAAIPFRLDESQNKWVSGLDVNDEYKANIFMSLARGLRVNGKDTGVFYDGMTDFLMATAFPDGKRFHVYEKGNPEAERNSERVYSMFAERAQKQGFPGDIPKPEPIDWPKFERDLIAWANRRMVEKGINRPPHGLGFHPDGTLADSTTSLDFNLGTLAPQTQSSRSGTHASAPSLGIQLTPLTPAASPSPASSGPAAA